MKYCKYLQLVLATTLLTIVFSIPTFAFNVVDIDFWVGTGSNSAAIAIDWNDGKNPETLVWGYHWEGSATGRDMLNAIKSADSRLFEPGDAYGGGTVFGLGYDLDNDGFTYVAGANDTGHAADMDDHYREGWMSAGYWSYWLKLDQTADWGYAMEGLATRKLTNGCWDGWVFAPASSGWDGGKPNNLVAAQAPVTAVPEPSTAYALFVGLTTMGGLALRRRK